MKLNDLKNLNVHIVGISGVEGKCLALFLIKLGCKNLTGHDFSNKKIEPKIADHFKIIHARSDYLINISEADLILAPSSWFRYAKNSSLKNFKKNQIFWTWYNLLLEFYPGILIGVTGTAGKGTTVNLIYSILKSAKKAVWKIGDSWQNFDLLKILKSNKKSFVVAEISNRTLTFAKYSKKSPQIAVITNITKNHLDDHQGSFAKYISVKKEIAKYQNNDDYLVLNSSDRQSIKLKNFNKSKKVLYSNKSTEASLIKNRNIFGRHLKADAVAAIKAAKILKIKKSAIVIGLNKFQPREGRMQLIKSINGIQFINDAACSRPEAAIEAIKSFKKGKVRLILEGYRYKPDKLQFLKLIKTIDEYQVKSVAISGKITNFLIPLFNKSSTFSAPIPVLEIPRRKIIRFHGHATHNGAGWKVLDKAKAEVIISKNLSESIKKTSAKSKKGDVVLLSPSCESFGEFKDYRERIKLFNKVVGGLRYK